MWSSNEANDRETIMIGGGTSMISLIFSFKIPDN